MGHHFDLSRRCGRGGMADAPDLGSGAARRKSSSLFVRTIYAVVAQLVERNLAKVEVASPSLVYRSTSILYGCAGVAQWQSSSLPSWSRGFDSHHPLHSPSAQLRERLAPEAGRINTRAYKAPDHSFTDGSGALRFWGQPLGAASSPSVQLYSLDLLSHPSSRQKGSPRDAIPRGLRWWKHAMRCRCAASSRL